MTDKPNLNERILSRKTAASDDDPDSFEDCGAFGFLRGVKDRALMLDFRLKSGNREAFPYTLLERITFDPSEGLTLHYLGVAVKLVGRNLAAVQPMGVSLLDALHRHRVPWIVEVDELRSAAKADKATVITQIAITSTKS